MQYWAFLVGVAWVHVPNGESWQQGTRLSKYDPALATNQTLPFFPYQMHNLSATEYAAFMHL